MIAVCAQFSIISVSLCRIQFSVTHDARLLWLLAHLCRLISLP